jgi:hypothetical protein
MFFETKYADQRDSNDEDPAEEEIGLNGVYTRQKISS